MARASIASPRNIAIAFGAGVLLTVVLVFARRSGEPDKPAMTASEAPTAAVATVPVVAAPIEPAHEVAAVDEAMGSGPGTVDDVEIEINEPDAEGSAAVDTGSGTDGTIATTPTPTMPTATATPTPTPTPAAPPPVAKKRTSFDALLKDKDVVLEYDGRIGRNGAPASEQAAITKARAAHVTGMQRMNAGDYDGALDNYRRALSHYPGYIGAYRGMGLAYERKGDKSNALKALRMYVSIVPNANDVAALRKRIDALSKH
jgi:hypothetical protein